MSHDDTSRGQSEPRASSSEMSVPRPSQVNDAQLAALVRAARTGDNDAWTRLIDRYDRVLRRIARSYRLGPADVDDVVQMAWIRLYQNIDRLREPAAIGHWVATTTRRQAMRVLQSHVREQPSDDPELGDVAASNPPETVVLAAEDRVVLGRAIAVLPGRQRELMTLLAAQPDANYQHISAALEMPKGSIGPTLARGLVRLRRDPELHSHYRGSA